MPSSILPASQAIISNGNVFLRFCRHVLQPQLHGRNRQEKIERLQLFPALTAVSRFSNGTSNPCLRHRKKTLRFHYEITVCNAGRMEDGGRWQKAAAGNLTEPYGYMETRLYIQKANFVTISDSASDVTKRYVLKQKRFHTFSAAYHNVLLCLLLIDSVCPEV